MPQLTIKLRDDVCGDHLHDQTRVLEGPRAEDPRVFYPSYALSYPGPGRGRRDPWRPSAEQREIAEEGKDLRLAVSYAYGDFFRAMQDKVGGVFARVSHGDVLKSAITQTNDPAFAEAGREYQRFQPTIDPIVHHFAQIRELKNGELRFVFERGYDLAYNVPLRELRRGFFWSRRLTLHELRQECVEFREFVERALESIGMSDYFFRWSRAP